MDLTRKKVGVYGLGVSGQATLRFLQDFPLRSLVIVNQGDPDSWGELPSFSFHKETLNEADSQASEALASCDFIVLSPGIPREAEPLKRALKAGVPVWNEIELGCRFYEGPLVTITGTNGKTTTVTLLGEALKDQGLHPFVGGNIGVPFLEGLKNQNSSYDLAVLEVSSFQCESLETLRPHVAAILNLFPNHGERYQSNEDYRKSKWLLAKNMKKEDYLLTGEGVGQPPFPLKAKWQEQGSHWEEDIEGFSLSSLKVVGKHNRKNIWFSYKVLKALEEKEFIQIDWKVFEKTLHRFPGVEHRVEFCGEKAGLHIYNDAKSTNWEATRTAVEAVMELGMPIHLVVGGQLRGHNDIPTESELNFLKKACQSLLSIGEAGNLFQEQGLPFEYREDLSRLKSYVDQKKLQGVLLFSPAFPSFDQFKNYAHRGQMFKSLFK